MAAANMDLSADAIRTARAMDLPAKLAIPLRVIASIVAISCQLDAHVPVRALAAELIPGFADEAA
jgi:predicted unusual protein kinase regulating ubiquinone biosynthesis (AarF/ABC1/UbiB family)